MFRILKVSSPSDWFYIPTKDNPADLVSRGTSLRLLRCHQLWFQGPSLDVIEASELQTKALEVLPLQSFFASSTVDNEIMSKLVAGVSFTQLRALIRFLVNTIHKFTNLVHRHKRDYGNKVYIFCRAASKCRRCDYVSALLVDSDELL